VIRSGYVMSVETDLAFIYDDRLEQRPYIFSKYRRPLDA
jgi:hypothetical protein